MPGEAGRSAAAPALDPSLHTGQNGEEGGREGLGGRRVWGLCGCALLLLLPAGGVTREAGRSAAAPALDPSLHTGQNGEE